MTQILDEKNHPELARARQDVNNAMMTLVESVAALQEIMYEALYQKAFDEGVEWLKAEFRKLSDLSTEAMTEPEQPRPGLSDIEKITDHSVFTHITNNPGWRTSDVIAKTLELPVKPALTENAIKATINRLKRAGKIDNKAGRWYSTQAKATNQQYQVMAYMPDGSKYLGTDVINERERV